MARFGYRLILILVAAASVAATGIAQAQTAPVAVIVSPVQTVVSGFNSVGEMLATATYEGRFAAQTSSTAQGLYYQRAVAFSETTVANGAKTRIALGGAIALSAAMLGVGYLLDQLHGQITAPPDSSPLTPLPAGWYYDVNGIHVTTIEGVKQALYGNPSYYYKFGPVQWMESSPGVFAYRAAKMDYSFAAGCQSPEQGGGGPCPTGGYNWFSVKDGNNIVQGPAVDPHFVRTGSPNPAPATDHQIAQVVKDHPETWKEITTSPTQKPYVWPPMTQQMQDVQTQFRKDTGTAPLPAGTAEPIAAPQPLATPTATTTVTAEPETGTTAKPTTETPTGSTEKLLDGDGKLKMPGFCNWAAVVCDAVAWFKTEAPDEADVPMPEKPLTPATWASGLGAGSCPAPAVAVVAGVTQTMTYQPLCDLATGVKPFLLIAAALFAAVMLAGALS